MRIVEQYGNLSLLSEYSYTHINRDGTVYTQTEEILTEHVLDIYINEILTMKVTCLPENLALLVLGRLLTEGIIQHSEEVELISICEFGKRAHVFLRDTKRMDHSNFIETTPTCCTGNRVLNDFFVSHKNLSAVQPIVFENEWIFSLADTFAKGSPLHEKTWATHVCMLARRGELLFSCEDLGRHNALDKVIGFALREDVPLNECIVYSSGRIPTDMITKAIRAGIPILASKASPTAEAIELAREYGITLICAARRDRMKQLS